MIGIEQQNQAIVDDPLAALVGGGDFLAVQKNPNGLGQAVMPLLLGHLPAIGVEPEDVVHAGTMDRLPLEPFAPTQHRMFVAERHQLAHEFQQRRVFLWQIPVQPGDLVILTIGIIVPMLGTAHFVAGQQHGNALRQE